MRARALMRKSAEAGKWYAARWHHLAGVGERVPALRAGFVVRESIPTSCKGGAFLHRYADDFVCGFGRAEEAQRFYNELEERLRKFGLELAKTKHGSFRSVVIARERRALSFWVSSFAGV